MKAVILAACGLLGLGVALYFTEGFVREIPRPMLAERLDGGSSIRLSAPDLGPRSIATNLAEAPAAQTAEQTVGTSGRDAAAGVPQTPSDVRLATAGQHVQLKVRADDINNDPAFAAGSGENQILVVMRRDTRTPEQDQEGVPPRHGIAPVDGGGHVVTIDGTIEPMPRYWEEMASWNLTRSEKLLLAEKGVYLRADRVSSEAYTATAAP
jgi:hypothetical protein